MIGVLVTTIPCGLHIGLSAALGHLARYAQEPPAQLKGFSVSGFVFTSLLSIVALTVFLFFVEAIPTMLYSMGMVALILRWPRRWRGQEKRASIVAGILLGLLMGLLVAAGGFLLLELAPSRALYDTLLDWPSILSIDGIALFWLTLMPVVHSVAGAQIGARLGKQMEEYLLYRFW